MNSITIKKTGLYVEQIQDVDEVNSYELIQMKTHCGLRDSGDYSWPTQNKILWSIAIGKFCPEKLSQ